MLCYITLKYMISYNMYYIVLILASPNIFSMGSSMEETSCWHSWVAWIAPDKLMI